LKNDLMAIYYKRVIPLLLATCQCFSDLGEAPSGNRNAKATTT